MAYNAKIIEDSICEGRRLTTVQVTSWVMTHAELNTHSAFGKNASSSRAIPSTKFLKNIKDDPFIPIFWGKNCSGMSPKEEIENKEEAIRIWLEARDNNINSTQKLVDLGVHKQIANRLLGPFAWITTAITGDQDGWSNFFSLRCHPDAQQEFQYPAYLIQREYFENIPNVLKAGQWHMPYTSLEEKNTIPEDLLIKISIGRTARTSYLTQEGNRDIQEDVKLFDRLLSKSPIHASPADQVCQATPGIKKGKYLGWTEFRKQISNEFITDFKPNYKEYFEEI